MRVGLAYCSRFSGWLFLALGFQGGLTGCVTAPATIQSEAMPPIQALREICQIGGNIQSATGRIWMKVTSREVKGQFVAEASVADTPAFNLQVLNFLGGREATLSLQAGKYEVLDSMGKPVKTHLDEGDRSWGGLPLRWANDLFLGKIPCPDLENSSAEWEKEGQLLVKEGSQKFLYSIKQNRKKIWPVSLAWTRLDERTDEQNLTFVEFQFDDSDIEERPVGLAGNLPVMVNKKWEARSNRGRLKIRWRDRESVLRPQASIGAVENEK